MAASLRTSSSYLLWPLLTMATTHYGHYSLWPLLTVSTAAAAADALRREVSAYQEINDKLEGTKVRSK